MKIIVSGQALATHAETGAVVTDAQLLQSLDGLRYDGDLCANYLDHKLLNDISLSGGAIEIAFDAQGGGLRVFSEYWTPSALSADQLQALVDQTLGQWSDGIGEGCFDEWSQNHGVGLDLAPFAMDNYEAPSAEQIEDGREAPRFAHLAKAVWNRRFDVVEQAVAAHADLNAIYDGHTALLLAILRNESRIALLLIEGGADVNRDSIMGTTPLMACSNMKQPDEAVAIATALLAKGANLNARDSNGDTAFDAAKKQRQTKLVSLLAARSVP